MVPSVEASSLRQLSGGYAALFAGRPCRISLYNGAQVIGISDDFVLKRLTKDTASFDKGIRIFIEKPGQITLGRLFDREHQETYLILDVFSEFRINRFSYRSGDAILFTRFSIRDTTN